MKISKADDDLVLAFLEREANYYRFSDIAKRHEFICRMRRLIDDGLAKLPEKGNYIHIESITSLGQLQAELVISAADYAFSPDAKCLLPPGPSGGVNVYEEEHGI